MPTRDIIVIGASAGGVDALREVARGLPPDIPASIFVVLHLSPFGTSYLALILSNAGKLRATQAEDREIFEYSRIYTAPPDRHMLLEKENRIRLWRGPRFNHTRPAIDPLFRSAARHYRNRVIGVVLSGTLDDGSAGLRTIQLQGGLTVVQSPEDAAFPDMPRNAIKNTNIDYITPASEIAPLLARLVREPIEMETTAMADELEEAEDIIEHDKAAQIDGERDGMPAVYTCPECGGSLWQVDEGEMVRFRCHTGHIFSHTGLIRGQTEQLENALWSALRLMVDRINAARQLAVRARVSGHPTIAERYEAQAKATTQHMETLKNVIETNGMMTVMDFPEGE